MMRDIGGVEMPEFFGRLLDESAQKREAETSEPEPEPSKE